MLFYRQILEGYKVKPNRVLIDWNELFEGVLKGNSSFSILR